MDLSRLRQDTAAEHSRTEETVPVMSPTLTREQYVDVLLRFYRVVKAWDQWADRNVPDDLRGLLAQRRRAALLADDLRRMDVTELPGGAQIPTGRMARTVPGESRSVFLGRMYVMEGSTLGGQFIARHVEERLHLRTGEDNSYFAGYGDATGQRWREFRAVLAELPDSETETVIDSAKDFFHLFGEIMQEDPARPETTDALAAAGLPPR